MKLYEINEAIDQVIENSDEYGVVDGSKLDELEVEKQDKIGNIAKYIKNLNSDISELKNEIDNLKKRMQVKKNKAEWLQNYLTDNIPEGTKIETPQYKISWRKSTRLEVDKNIVMASFYESYPEHCSLSYKLDKKLLKKDMNSDKVFSGVWLKEYNNINVK